MTAAAKDEGLDWIRVCTLDDLPISVSDDIERSSLRAVRGPEILSFPLNALGGPVRLL